MCVLFYQEANKTKRLLIEQSAPQIGKSGRRQWLSCTTYNAQRTSHTHILAHHT